MARAFRPEAPTNGLGAPILVSLVPGVALFAVFFLVPLGILVATSFTDWTLASVRWVGLDNYAAILSDRGFWKAATNTAVFVSATLLIQIPLATLVALLLAGRRRGWTVIRAILYLPIMVSGVALGLVFSFVYNTRYGLLNGLVSAVGLEDLRHDWLFDVSTAVPAVVGTYVFLIGFFVILILTEALSIPADLTEAAVVDGASTTQVHRHVTLPMLRHVLGTCVLLGTLGAVAFFDSVYVLTAGGPGDATLTLGLYTFRAYNNGEWGFANAAGSLIIALGVGVILGVRRMFRFGQPD